MSDPSAHDHAPVEDKDARNPGDLMFGWTSHPRAGFFVFIGVSALCAALFIADFLVHRHEYVHLAEFPAFYALFGFAAFAGVVLSGWPLRKLLGRPENYYEPEDQEND